MKRLVEHILYIGNREKGGINNLELNKVLCLSFRDYVHEYGKNPLVLSLYDNHFEFWPYGLTYRKSYWEYKHLGIRSIPAKGKYHEELSGFDKYVLKWLETPLKEMVNISQDYEDWRRYMNCIQKGYTISVSLDEL